MAEPIVKTAFCDIVIRPTEYNHIFVEAAPTHILTVRNIDYNFSAHLYLWADGCFYIGREGKNDWERRHSLYMSKYGVEYRKSEASESARKSVQEEIERKVNLWAIRNKLKIAKAEMRYLREAIASRRATLKELAAAKKEIEAEIKQLDKGEHLLSSDRFTLTTTRAKEE